LKPATSALWENAARAVLDRQCWKHVLRKDERLVAVHEQPLGQQVGDLFEGDTALDLDGA
jgi:hypothetical protein